VGRRVHRQATVEPVCRSAGTGCAEPGVPGSIPSAFSTLGSVGGPPCHDPKWSARACRVGGGSDRDAGEIGVDLAIRRLILKRFRSIPAERLDFDNPTFLVGRNGSGKSNLVDALAFLAEAMASPLQAVFDKRGGIASVRNRTSGKSYPPNLGFGVEFGAVNGELTGARYSFEIRALQNYGFEVLREQCSVRTKKGRFWFDRKKGAFDSNVAGLRPAFDAASLGLPVVGGDARFAPNRGGACGGGRASRPAAAAAKRDRGVRGRLPQADPPQAFGAGVGTASAKRRPPRAPEAGMPGDPDRLTTVPLTLLRSSGAGLRMRPERFRARSSSHIANTRLGSWRHWKTRIQLPRPCEMRRANCPIVSTAATCRPSTNPRCPRPSTCRGPTRGAVRSGSWSRPSVNSSSGSELGCPSGHRPRGSRPDSRKRAGSRPAGRPGTTAPECHSTPWVPVLGPPLRLAGTL
jgi:hypothetical protein